jgi:uncharacterized phage protein (TIGR02218 family)
VGFSLFEIASRSGKPIGLYEFTWDKTIWRYTSADRDIEYGVDEDDNPIIWEAISITDDGYTQGSSGEPFKVTMPARLEIPQLFRSTPPSLPIWLKVRRFHKDDPDQEMIVYWVGTVGNVKRPTRLKAEIIGLPISQTMHRSGARLCWERGCNHALYDTQCRVDKELFKTEAEITALTGTRITVDTIGAFPAERYRGGILEWVVNEDGTIDRRQIEEHVAGETFELLGTTDRLEVGMAVTLYCGCDLTAETCDTFFNNLPNHGGMEFLPGTSPFDGRTVFY